MNNHDLKNLKVSDDRIAHAETFGKILFSNDFKTNDEIKHYGVKGMKWDKSKRKNKVDISEAMDNFGNKVDEYKFGRTIDRVAKAAPDVNEVDREDRIPVLPGVDPQGAPFKIMKAIYNFDKATNFAISNTVSDIIKWFKK